jgi:hypothetical protein
VTDAVPDRVAGLFRQSPDGFIAARDDLVKRLREEGRSDDATAVKALRKPSVAAWALNQLAERDPEGIRALLDAGAELRAAQHATMSSAQNAGRMREAAERRRQAVTRLSREAADVFSASGRASGPHLDEVMAALEAASIDTAAGERLMAGTFERPPAPPVGLGDVTGLRSIVTGDEVPERDDGPGPRSSQGSGPPKQRVADHGAILTSEVARLRRDRETAARRLSKDRGSAALLARESADLEARLTRVREKLDEAGARVKAAELETRSAERALKRAEERLARSEEP